MAKTASDTPSADAEEALKRRKKQARREAKLMLEIDAANRDLKKAQKKQSKAQARLEARSTALQTLEVKLEELRAQSLEPAIEATPPGAELESQDAEPTPSLIAGDTAPEVMAVTNEAAEGSEGSETAAVQDNETATSTEPAQTLTTPRKAPSPKTAATRKPTATKRPASRSQSTRQPPSHTE